MTVSSSAFSEADNSVQPTHDGYERRSEYVAVSDGTRLALDVFRPTLGGQPAAPLPVILKVFRYGRAWVYSDGRLEHALSDETVRPPSIVAGRTAQPRLNVLRWLAMRGYAIAVMDVRGGGASFGQSTGHQSREGARDVADVIAWLASHPWCDGNVGTFGRSFAGTSQIVAASLAPPALKAMFPGVHPFDEHQTVLAGGIYRKAVLETYQQLTQTVDGFVETVTRIVAPVDADPAGRLRDAALAERRSDPGIRHFVEFFRSNPGNHRSRASYAQPPRTGPVNAATLLPEVLAALIPMYHFDGWLDFSVDAGILLFQNWIAPRKLVIGPWTHSPDEPDDPREDESVRIEAIEALRWFDHWLKGRRNGVMDEPPITYAVMHSGQRWDWRRSMAWPPPESVESYWLFEPGRSGSVDSCNDGRLLEASVDPGRARPAGYDERTVDYGTSLGQCTRWTESTGFGPVCYPDLAANDARCITYTSEPFERSVTFVGAPIADIWVGSSAPDGDFFVYVERVLADGESEYLTEGQLRASHRKLGEAPYGTGGMPWTTSYPEDVRSCPPLALDHATRLYFALMPFCASIAAGERLRITIAGSDADSMVTPVVEPAPIMRIFRGAGTPSGLTLRVLPP